MALSSITERNRLTWGMGDSPLLNPNSDEIADFAATIRILDDNRRILFLHLVVKYRDLVNDIFEIDWHKPPGAVELVSVRERLLNIVGDFLEDKELHSLQNWAEKSDDISAENQEEMPGNAFALNETVTSDLRWQYALHDYHSASLWSRTMLQSRKLNGENTTTNSKDWTDHEMKAAGEFAIISGILSHRLRNLLLVLATSHDCTPEEYQVTRYELFPESRLDAIRSRRLFYFLTGLVDSITLMTKENWFVAAVQADHGGSQPNVPSFLLELERELLKIVTDFKYDMYPQDYFPIRTRIMEITRLIEQISKSPEAKIRLDSIVKIGAILDPNILKDFIDGDKLEKMWQESDKDRPAGQQSEGSGTADVEIDEEFRQFQLYLAEPLLTLLDFVKNSVGSRELLQKSEEDFRR